MTPAMKRSLFVWLALILIVLVEVALAMAHPPVGLLVASLLVLAGLEAGIALLYFMHLRYDRPILLWSIVPTLLFVFLMLNQFWPDALRLLRMRLPAP